MEINLKEGRIHIGAGCWDNFHNFKSEYNKALVIIDKKVYQLYQDKIDKLLDGMSNKKVFLDSPENQKNLDTISYLTEEAMSFELTRYDLVMAIGGGATGDLSGFFASIYKRGISYFSFPTTLIAQVDSSIGGKTAVNHNGIKNLLGTFYPPLETFIDPSLLITLETLDFVGGLGEVLKYALLEPNFFAILNGNFKRVLNMDLNELEKVVLHCVQLKNQVVESDYYETQGMRISLNLGHTLGHIIENKPPDFLNHGLSVVVGMKFAIYLSLELGLLSKDGYDRRQELLQLLLNYIPRFNLDSYLIELERLHTDKKNTGKLIQFVIPTDGEFSIVKLTNQELRKYIMNYSGEHYD